MITIEQADNGYILDRGIGTKEVFITLQPLFNRLLLYFLGKAESFHGEAYGKVTVELEKKS